jgi:hypothetical protein
MEYSLPFFAGAFPQKTELVVYLQQVAKIAGFLIFGHSYTK